ncbi:hypothetical protein CSOJ01_05176 [Colletotrichum sojae]|uniref:Uncharacterized protein n=1 Tax=Colletotrichum sojae TaxID=2175907 RepID=A0A8H6JGZ0_9PEZI|nr:hypothetical protein CSOJ01_05176 [Colletotrichum sojae]
MMLAPQARVAAGPNGRVTQRTRADAPGNRDPQPLPGPPGSRGSDLTLLGEVDTPGRNPMLPWFSLKKPRKPPPFRPRPVVPRHRPCPVLLQRGRFRAFGPLPCALSAVPSPVITKAVKAAGSAPARNPRTCVGCRRLLTWPGPEGVLRSDSSPVRRIVHLQLENARGRLRVTLLLS